MKNPLWLTALVRVAPLVALVPGCWWALEPQPVVVAPPPPPPPQYAPPPPAQPMPPPVAEAPPPEVMAAPVAAADESTIYPTMPPPDPIPEVRPPAPAWGYVWIDGYWDWAGVDWTWNSGYWMPQRAGVVYFAPRFVFVDGRPVYYRSYWAGPGGRREYGYGWRGAPPAAWRARPSAAPAAWRAEHNAAWRSTPGAGTYRGPAGHMEPAHAMRPNEPHGNFQQHPGANQPNGNFQHPGQAGQPNGNFQHPGQPGAAAPNPHHPGGQPPMGAANRASMPPAGAAHPPAPAPRPAAPAPRPAPSRPAPSGGGRKK
jgi:hypothetical protein